ncbi:hypothetical protein D9757_005955 [Collybiopsis confluens]|uniref:Hydrophobin n=1 Tax=Collybiopsis confluens TaxID=2823264 RepID=A0A8H5HUW5_9AGAR|nr:hypothetical protein D9757_005955 [Collybiopsis confluens]
MEMYWIGAYRTSRVKINPRAGGCGVLMFTRGYSLGIKVKLAFISAALATLVVATPTPRDDEPASSCTTGSLQCCNSLVSPGSIEGDVAISVLAISVEDPNVLFGLTCSPITSTAGSSW